MSNLSKYLLREYIKGQNFKPKIIQKHQRSLSGIEDKILSLYATGMTIRDISEQIKELCDIEISDETVSNITNRGKIGP